VSEYPHQQLTEQIIGAAICVHRALGPGFLESIYENALVHQLRKIGLAVEQQRTVAVWYDGIKVGEHRLDIVVENRVLLELKATQGLSPVATAQVLSSLKAAGLTVGLLISFNEPVVKNGIKRIVLTQQGQPDAGEQVLCALCDSAAYYE